MLTGGLCMHRWRSLIGRTVEDKWRKVTCRRGRASGSEGGVARRDRIDILGAHVVAGEIALDVSQTSLKRFARSLKKYLRTLKIQQISVRRRERVRRSPHPAIFPAEAPQTNVLVPSPPRHWPRPFCVRSKSAPKTICAPAAIGCSERAGYSPYCRLRNP